MRMDSGVQSQRLSLVGLVFMLSCSNGELRRVGAAQVESETFSLPQALIAARGPICLETLPSRGTLVGGKGGLFLLQHGLFEQVDDREVVAILPAGEQLLVVTPERTRLWSGALHDFDLISAFDTSPIRAAGGDAQSELWLATHSRLWLYQSGRLQSFSDFFGVESILGAPSKHIAVVRQQGEFWLIRREQEQWITRSVRHTDQDLQTIIPFGSALLALAPAGVFRQAVGGEGTAWSHFELGNNAGLSHLAPGASDSAWAIGSEVWYVDSAGDVNQALLDEPVAAAVAQVDQSGALWLANENELVRIALVGAPAIDMGLDRQQPDAGPSQVDGSAPVGDSALTDGVGSLGYADSIAPFIEANCARCHVETTATPQNYVGLSLASYEEVKIMLPFIIEDLQLGLMPADGEKLVGGDVNLFIEWKNGGLKP
jgi:hypothetical protein